MIMCLALALLRCPILPCPWFTGLVGAAAGAAVGYYVGKKTGSKS